MGDQDQTGTRQEKNVGGYQVGDRIGMGEVVSPEHADEPGVKEVYVDTNLNRVKDAGDSVIYVKQPTGIRGMVSSLLTKMGSMIPAFRPRTEIPDLVEPKDEISQELLQVDEELQEAEQDIGAHYTFTSLEDLQKVKSHLEEIQRRDPQNPYLAEREARLRKDIRTFLDTEIGRNVDEAQDSLSKGMLFGNFDTSEMIRTMHAVLERFYQGRELQPGYEIPQPVVEQYRQTLTQMVEILENRNRFGQKLTPEEADFIYWGKHKLDTFHGGRPVGGETNTP